MSKNELINITETCIFSLYLVTLVHDHLPANHQNEDDIMIILNFLHANDLGSSYLKDVICRDGDLSALTFNKLKTI